MSGEAGNEGPGSASAVGFRSASPLHKNKQTPGEAPGVEIGLSSNEFGHSPKTAHTIHNPAPQGAKEPSPGA